MDVEFLLDGVPHRFSLEREKDAYLFKEGDTTVKIDLRPVSENECLLTAGGKTFRVCVASLGKQRFISVDGRVFAITESGADSGQVRSGDEKMPEGTLRVKAPMPGKVIKILAAEGDSVRKNQTLAVVEAMKMENEIKSSIEGVVMKIMTTVGELVDSEKPLIEIEPKT